MEFDMAYCWKEEWYVYEGDDVIAWCDTFSEAAKYTNNPAVTKIELVKHYQDDCSIAWER